MARRLALLLPVILTGCLLDPPPPAVELDLYQGPVSCDESTGVCEPAVAEYHRVPVRLRELPPSAGYPRGALLVSFRLRRGPGHEAAVSLEIPVDVETPSAPPRLSYRETGGSGPAFNATRVAGRIELSWDRACPCQTGRFELELTDPGPDGELDTADDRHRRLSRGRLRRGDRPFCHGRAVLAIKPGLLVVGSRSCPVARSAGRGGACAWDWVGAAWAADWNDDAWYDETWDGDWEAGGCDDGWDEEWTDEEWTDEDWQDCCWGDDGWFGDDSGDDWDNPSAGSWGDDDWGDDDGGDDWGDDWWGDDDGGDDWGDDDWGDDGGDDDWGDDGGDDDWGDDWWDE